MRLGTGLVRGRSLEPKARLREELRPVVLRVGSVVLAALVPLLWLAWRADRRGQRRPEEGRRDDAPPPPTNRKAH